MTPRPKLIVHIGPISLAAAEQVMMSHKIKKLPLVNVDDTVLGLITAKNLLNHRRHPFATRDEDGRLRVAAAVGATGDYLERAAEVRRAGADVIVMDIAHGHSDVMERAIERLRKQHAGVDLIAGNVATAEGARFLLERGVNGVKVGIGPGGGCTTRHNHQLRRAAGRGACRMLRGGWGPGPAHCRRRRPPRRRHRPGTAVRWRHGDARQRICGNGGDAGRSRAETSPDGGIPKDREGAI